jgi:hypothetical protein
VTHTVNSLGQPIGAALPDWRPPPLRRYEWKCDTFNEPSRTAAQRYGLSFEGVSVVADGTAAKGQIREWLWRMKALGGPALTALTRLQLAATLVGCGATTPPAEPSTVTLRAEASTAAPRPPVAPSAAASASPDPSPSPHAASALTRPAATVEPKEATPPQPPPADVTARADQASAFGANPMLLRALLGGEPSKPSDFDHPRGQPLLGTCSLEAVRWKDTPSLYGLEGLVQVKDRVEAADRGTRAYAHLKQQLIDLDPKPRRNQKSKNAPAPPHHGTDLAVISVMHFAPVEDGSLVEWGEIYILGLRDCIVSPLVVARTGPKPLKDASKANVPRK